MDRGPEHEPSVGDAHLKASALNGGREHLTDEELAFVGVGVLPASKTRGGWCQPGEISGLFAVDEQDADPEFAAVLQALVTRDRLEFLGG